MNEWAIDAIDDIAKDDPLRLLDLENDTQVLLSKIPGAKSETERARSNFNKLIYKEPKPLDEHILEAAGRAIPNVAAVGASPLLKIGKSIIVKAGKDFVKKAATKNIKRNAIEKAQKKLDKTLIKAITNRFNPNSMTHYKIAKASNKLTGDAKEALQSFDTSVDRVIRERLEKMPGDLTLRYQVMLQEAPRIAKSTNIDEGTIVRAIKNEANDLYRKPLLEKLNFKAKIGNDAAANPDLYKGLSDEKKVALYKSRKAENSSINKSAVYDNTGITRAVQAADVNIPTDVIKDASIREIVAHAPRAIDMLKDSVEKPVIENKEFKQFLFDKPPETSPIKDVLEDILGVDYYNPNRWRQEDVEWLLNEAQKEGLLSDDSWKQWSPRQKVYKMREIVESPMAITFMKGIRE